MRCGDLSDLPIKTRSTVGETQGRADRCFKGLESLASSFKTADRYRIDMSTSSRKRTGAWEGRVGGSADAQPPKLGAESEIAYGVYVGQVSKK